MLAGAAPARCSAAVIRLCCEGPWGAVRALARPFVFTAVPTIIARGVLLVSDPSILGGDLDPRRLGVGAPLCGASPGLGGLPCFGGSPLGNEVLLASGDGWEMGGLSGPDGVGGSMRGAVTGAKGRSTMDWHASART